MPARKVALLGGTRSPKGLSGRAWPTVVHDFPTADPVGTKHVVFNICGNKYRLVCTVFFPAKTLWVKFVGTHANYDKIKVKEL